MDQDIFEGIETEDCIDLIRRREDRREHPRYELTLAITVQGDNNLYTTISSDVSEGGLFIATHFLLPVGTPVRLSFTVPTMPNPIRVEGTVRWVRAPAALVDDGSNFSVAPSSVKPGMGVQFSGLSAEAKTALRRFLRYRSPEFFE